MKRIIVKNETFGHGGEICPAGSIGAPIEPIFVINLN